MNEFHENKADTPERTVAERHIEAVRQQGGVFVEAVRRTRMPMLVTDATLPGNPIVFANQSFVDLSGYTMDELLGQAGDTVWIPPGEKHWHGAAPRTGMVHISMQEALDGSHVTWLEHVTDEQYGVQPDA